jgi:RNA polymerase sigma factor (sigma-70 family)
MEQTPRPEDSPLQLQLKQAHAAALEAQRLWTEDPVGNAARAETEFTRMVILTKPLLYGALSSRNVVGPVADEVITESYLRSYRQLLQGKFRGDGPVSAWLYTITLNRLRTYYRDEARRLKHEEPADDLTFFESVRNYTDFAEEVVSVEAIRRLVEDLDRSISPKERHILRALIRDTPYLEVAVAAGITAVALKMRISRLRKKAKSIASEHIE